MLNYKNDSLLLDKETANDLIKKRKEDLIFLDKEKKILNLYSAFVKKTDFIKKDKLNQPFQKTVYVKISKELTEKINKKFSNKKQLKKLMENYIDRRSNVNVNKWFENQIFPYVLLRIISKNKKELSGLTNEIIYFTDFVHRSKFYPPKTVNELLKNKLIYLVGCSVGDGHIDKVGKRWTLVDGSSCKKRLVFSKMFIDNLVSLISEYTDGFKITEYETKYTLTLNNKLFCRFLNFFFGLPYGKKKDTVLRKPLILKQSNKDLEKYFWRGCFDTDGSASKKGVVDLSSSDNHLLNECEHYLKKIGIVAKRRKYLLDIGISYLDKFSCIGFSHPRKQKEFLVSLKKGPKFKSVKIKKDQKENINKKLLGVYDSFRIDSNYRVRVHSVVLREKKISIKQINEIVEELFDYKFKIASNGLYYFKSKKVHNYLRGLFMYEPAWKPITNNEETQLLNSWNGVWIK